MAVQYWVGDFFIDLSRNQITRNAQSQTLAPKALAVLTCLAENQGRVVGYDELLSKVWPDTIVTPNTLQRSIAQLRKALAEDSKYQSCIETHAKQGYSLECDVRWHHQTESKSPLAYKPEVAQQPTQNLEQKLRSKTQPKIEVEAGESSTRTQSSPQNEVGETPIDQADKARFSRLGLQLMSVFAGIVILGVIGFWYLAPEQTSPINFDKLRSLTATDDKEFDATYAPDGKYIVFHRYKQKLCVNNLWAKNITTQAETQLTKDLGSYGRHSFSKDGKNLVFIAIENCGQPVTQKRCYNLVKFNFEKALGSPQSPSVLMQCTNSALKQPIWLNNKHIAVLQKKSKRWKLIDYSITENKSTDLYDLKDGNLMGFAYSVTQDLIAVTSIHNDGQHYLEMLRPDGRIISSHLIERPQEMPQFRSIQPDFDPLNKQLIFSTGRQLFTLSYEGKIAKISLPFDEAMWHPKFHPDGKKILLIKGRYDSDIASIPLDQPDQESSLTSTKQDEIYSSLERSTLGEDGAVFQPNGELIAFWSERSGEEQIWLTTGNGSQQLTHFPIDTYIYGFAWAADGQSVLVNANRMLTQVFLNADQKSIRFEHPVEQIFQWNSEDNKVLLIARIKGILKFVELNLNNSEFSVLTDKKINWALRSEDGQLIYTDNMNRFWQPGPAEDQLIKPLDGQGSSKRFVIKDNVIYGINSENQLWSYDLSEGTFKTLRDIHQDVDYLTGINETHLLITFLIAAKKEVVELSLSE